MSDKGGTITCLLKTPSYEDLGRAFQTEGLRLLRGDVTRVLEKIRGMSPGEKRWERGRHGPENVEAEHQGEYKEFGFYSSTMGRNWILSEAMIIHVYTFAL